MSLVECLGCKKYPCTIGSDTQKEKLYYDEPFWFCHNCATIVNNIFTIIPEERQKNLNKMIIAVAKFTKKSKEEIKDQYLEELEAKGEQIAYNNLKVFYEVNVASPVIEKEGPPCEQDVYTKEMANNDQTFNSLDSPPVWNKRIRELVRNCYHKGFLQQEHLVQFAEWEKKINAPDFPKYASRFALFQAAPELCLHVIGV